MPLRLLARNYKSMSHDRILALDYGQKRIGVAVSDPLGITAQALAYIPHTDTMYTILNTLISRYDSRILLVGYPYDTRGGRTQSCDTIDTFITTLKDTTPCTVILHDERLSTIAAMRQLDALGLSRKKQRHRIDSQAAAFMLQGYLDKIAS